MELEVGHGHLAREDEGHEPREEAGQNEQTADQLEHAADPYLGHELGMSPVPARDAAEPVEYLHTAGLHEDEPRHHAQQEHGDRYRPISVHGMPPCFSRSPPRYFDVGLGHSIPLPG